MAYKYNPFTGKLDLVGAGTDPTIQEYDADPTSPTAETAWVLKAGGAGTPIGLLLSLTYDGSAPTYQLSYRTLESTTVRVPLT